MRKTVLLFLFLLAAALAQSVSPEQCTKTPYESFNLSVDFSPVVGTDAITLSSITATNTATNADSTASIISSSPAPYVSGEKIIFRVTGGRIGDNHFVSVKVVDSVSGEKFEADLHLQVKQTR